MTVKPGAPKRAAQVAQAAAQAMSGNYMPLARLIVPSLASLLVLVASCAAASVAAFSIGAAAGFSLDHAANGGSNHNIASTCSTQLVMTGSISTQVPEVYRGIFVKAAGAYGTDVNLLTSIFYVENGRTFPDPPAPYGHGRAWSVSGPGAAGPFQFMPGTWQSNGVDGNNDGRVDVNDLTDASFAAAKFLKSLGGTPGTPLGDVNNPHQKPSLVNVMASYNAGAASSFQATETINYVHYGAAFYKQLTSDPTSNPAATTQAKVCTAHPVAATAPASDRAQQVLAFARSKEGIPYLWGGTGLPSQDGRYDCSGLTGAAYRSIGINLPRVASDQFAAFAGTPKEVHALAQLQPGDLIFFGNTAATIHHVALFSKRDPDGKMYMIDAPDTGTVIREEVFAGPLGPTSGWSDYYGAARPLANG